MVQHEFRQSTIKWWSSNLTAKALWWEQVYIIQSVPFIMFLSTEVARWYPSGCRLLYNKARPTLRSLPTNDILIASWCQLWELECETCTIRGDSDKNRANSNSELDVLWHIPLPVLMAQGTDHVWCHGMCRPPYCYHGYDTKWSVATRK